MNSVMHFETSKSGLPCLWEAGGAGRNTGSAVIICTAEGQPKQAIYCPTKGQLSNGNHALIPVQVGDLVIKAAQWRREIEITIYKIASLDVDLEEVTLEQIHDFSSNEWDKEPATELKAAIDAAVNKSQSYHCRAVRYALFPKGYNR